MSRHGQGILQLTFFTSYTRHSLSYIYRFNRNAYYFFRMYIPIPVGLININGTSYRRARCQNSDKFVVNYTRATNIGEEDFAH